MNQRLVDLNSGIIPTDPENSDMLGSKEEDEFLLSEHNECRPVLHFVNVPGHSL